MRRFFLPLLASLVALVAISPAAAKERLPAVPGQSIIYEDVGFEVPAPGGSVAYEELRENGAKFVQVETDSQGVVWGVPEHVEEGDDGANASPPACSDNAWTFWDLTGSTGVQDGKWYDQYVFAFRGDTVPDGLSAFNARNRVIDAFRTWENAVNNCGRADNINFDGALVGNTGNINVPGDGSGCNVAHDGNSAVGFGTISVSGVLAFACVWSIPAPVGGNTDREIVEGDIKFDSSDRSWSAQDSTSGCSGNTFMLEAVAAHEFGHTAAGLHHVSEADHRNLTMSTQISPCDNRESDLGLGDMIGAEQNY